MIDTFSSGVAFAIIDSLFIPTLLPICLAANKLSPLINIKSTPNFFNDDNDFSANGFGLSEIPIIPLRELFIAT